jgi:hypothetical protein
MKRCKFGVNFAMEFSDISRAKNIARITVDVDTAGCTSAKVKICFFMI